MRVVSDVRKHFGPWNETLSTIVFKRVLELPDPLISIHFENESYQQIYMAWYIENHAIDVHSIPTLIQIQTL